MHNIIRYRNRPYLPFEARKQQSETSDSADTPSGPLHHVKNYHTDYRLKSRELHLYNATRNDAALSVIASIDAVKSWDERLQALGMAITILNNRGEEGKAKTYATAICKNFPKHQSIKIDADPALNLRGLAFILQCQDKETLYDATIYALGLRLGSDAKQQILDSHYINGFGASWSARLALTGH
ncbi:hypothetical protein [Vagococcus sp. WN89Y]|uniref:hypothetical protein n=1 Tax=Vagococcus sp. WN89Y TaxID=3457258 RepID=UPI003FCEDC33